MRRSWRPVVRGLLALALSFALAGCRGSRSPLREVAESSLHDGELSPARPIFNVRSLRDSQAYYRDRLGFKVDWEHGDPPDFGSVSRGHGALFICQGCQGGGGAWVFIFTENVDKLYSEFQAKHAFIRMPPTNMPWQLRELWVADPDGNVIRLAAPIEH